MTAAELAAAYAAILALVTPVATDPKRLKPGQLAHLLNSTPLGHVLKDRRLRGHRERAGQRIGDDKSIDLLRYVAWLVIEARDAGCGMQDAGNTATRRQAAAEGRYEAKKERERKRNATASRSGRDIGKLPPPVDPKRRATAAKSFRFFCETYLAELFPLAWSDDHLKLIATVEETVLAGGQHAIAMPRGSGKTTILEAAILWAAVNGHRKFAMLIGASKPSADEMMDSIKATLETNELLAEDYPEVCLPTRALEGIANRCSGQLCCGERTFIGWTKSQIILPTIAGSRASGTIVRTAGLTGRVRGAKYKRRDGENQRPDLALVDDPQTDASARSIGQCEKREKLIAGAVLGLAGPGKEIAAFCTCTVVRRGDLADVLLDHNKHPAWRGARCKLVYAFPKNHKLWEDYAIRLTDELKNGGDGSMATAFYKKHRVAMDKGAKVGWPARYKPGLEVSALQHAMNLKIADEAAFFAEYQNEPLAEHQDTDALDFDQLCKRGTGLARGRVPKECHKLTGMIDIQQKALFGIVCGWTPDFGGHVIDYGTWPDQQRRHFTLSDVQTTIQSKFKGAALEGCIFQALEAYASELLDRKFIREDGLEMRIEKLLVDVNWGPATEIAYQWCRQFSRNALVMPSHGKYFGAAGTPFAQYKRKEGEILGLHWWIPNLTRKRAIQHVNVDVNWWKSFIAQRLLTTVGDRGALTFCGKSGAEQRMLAEHCTAEFTAKTKNRDKAGGHECEEWRLKPNRDNHFWDGLVGAAVGASMLGVNLLASQAQKTAAAEAPRPTVRVRYF